MKGWVVRGVGSPKEVYEWDDVPEPSHEAMRALTVDFAGLRERREGEPPFESYVFIDVLASALATPDITMATNEYPIPEPVPRPYVSGQEAVGIAYDASPDFAHLIGKRVMGFTTQPYGSFAPKAVVMPPNLYEVPDDMSDEEAAGFSMAALTAYFVVHHRGKIQSGETVLILGAAGGVPSAAVQLCKPLMETTSAEWDAVMAVNLRTAFLMMQSSYPLLSVRGGAIVNVGSVHARATSKKIAAYAASKGGLESLTRAASLEFAASGIRVNGVHPGAVDTDMLKAGLNRGHLDNETSEMLVEQLGEKHPLGRVGLPEEIAETIFFLADAQKSSFISGTFLVSDGGALSHLSTE